MANELKEKHQRLKKVRTRNIVLNSICILLAGSGIWWTANYFWRYINYEVTNDAFVDQYIAPLNIRASGYIKEVRFKEHQYVHQGDTLLILDDREYRIKVKEAEAALIDAQGSQDVLRSGIETSHTNIAVQDANIAEAKAKLWQLEQDYHRFERLLKEESIPEQQYEQSKAAGDASADLTYEDMLAAGVGIEAPDDYTLVFTCKDPCPYFDTVAAYNSFYPVAPALLDELGIEGFRGCDNTTMWYNGPYLIEEYIQGNTKSYIPNPSYYDAANVSRFERLTITMISDGTISLQLYQNRELDEVDLGESSIATIQADPSNEYNQQMCEKRPKKFSYCFIFNYDKRKTDGTADENWNKAIANKAFRQCFSKGLELTKFFSRYNPINPLKCENDFFTMSGLCYTSDGTDYTSLVAKEIGLDGEKYDGQTMKRLRANNGDITDLKKQAMEELSAIGVTFPVHCSYYILAGSTTALDSATVLKQCFTDSFGDDFIVLDIETFVSSTMKEVVAPKLQSFVHMGWGADFGDPINFLTQIIVHDDNAYYSCNMTNIEGIVENGPADYQQELVDAYEQFTDLVNEGRAIVNDTDARYAAFAKAEAYFLEENLIFPTVYDVTWCLTHANEYTKINAMYGPCNYKAINWETSEEAYTTEQYEEFAAAFDAATKG